MFILLYCILQFLSFCFWKTKYVCLFAPGWTSDMNSLSFSIWQCSKWLLIMFFMNECLDTFSVMRLLLTISGNKCLMHFCPWNGYWNVTSWKTRTCPSDDINIGMASDKHKSNLIIPPANKSWEVLPVCLSLCLISLCTCITLIYTHNTLQGSIS